MRQPAVNGSYHPTREEIAVVSNIVRGGVAMRLGNSELVWHQDMTYKELPPKASILYGLTNLKQVATRTFITLTWL